jgi:hypothetical protein
MHHRITTSRGHENQRKLWKKCYFNIAMTERAREKVANAEKDEGKSDRESEPY